MGWITGQHSIYLVYGPLSNGATCSLVAEGAPNQPGLGPLPAEIIEKHKVTVLPYTAPICYPRLHSAQGNGDLAREVGSIEFAASGQRWRAHQSRGVRIWYREHVGKNRAAQSSTLVQVWRPARSC